MDSENIPRYVESARDMLAIGLESAWHQVNEATADISEVEYHWEPIPETERSTDLLLPPDRKSVWRVFLKEGQWTYDYTPETLSRPPFITIAWIMNHIAQSGDMYLYCVKTGKPEGIERYWDDLPVPSTLEQMSQYIFQVIDMTGEFLNSIPKEEINTEINKLMPAPWGEMRPVYKNLWGGIINHMIEHAAQISALKQRMRLGY